MPLYEYKCLECEIAFSQIKPMQLRDDCPACPRCGHGTHRSFSAVGLVKIKGGGTRNIGPIKMRPIEDHLASEDGKPYRPNSFPT